MKKPQTSTWLHRLKGCGPIQGRYPPHNNAFQRTPLPCGSGSLTRFARSAPLNAGVRRSIFLADFMVDATTIVVDAPLHGEWVATQTPAERVPSHGTDYLGQRFAYDFVRLHRTSNLPYEKGFWRHLLVSLPAESFLCWDEPVFSVFDGVVSATADEWPDRLRVNLVTALAAGYLTAPRVSAQDLRPLAGNYVVIRREGAAAFYAHLRLGSICVRPGQEVRTGQIVGRVGNSGNSTMPHLHLHMMDGPNPEMALGVPCCFRRYERFRSGEWERVDEGVPAKLERIRWLPAA
jgi:hypothetical protein